MQARRRNWQKFFNQHWNISDTYNYSLCQMGHSLYLILASHSCWLCHDVELKQLWFSVVHQLFLNNTHKYSTAFFNVMMFYLILVIVYIVPRADIYQYCENKSPIHACSLSWITELPERDRGHLAKIMYHIRNCTKFDKTDVVTKWLSKGKRSMSMFLSPVGVLRETEIEMTLSHYSDISNALWCDH